MIQRSKSILESITAIHGIAQCTSRKGKGSMLWSVLMLANMLLTVGYLFVISSRFNNDQIITRINANCKINQVPFPAVSICNFNLVSLKQTTGITKILKMNNITQQEIESFYRSIPNLTNFANTSPASGNFTQIMSILKQHYFTVDTIMEEVHQTCEDMLLYCTFNRKQKSCSEIFNLIKTYDGHCCTFNYAGLNDDSIDDIFDDEDIEYYLDPSGINLKSSGIVVTSESGKGSGLSLVFNVEPNDYPAWSTTPYNGAKILITDPNDYPETTVLYKYVIIGESLDIKVEPLIFQAEDDIRRVPVEKRSCMFHDEAALVHTDRYSTETCITQCKMQSYADNCGCIPYKYPREKVRICEFEDLKCLNNLRAHKPKGGKPCNPFCYIECRDKKYMITSDVMPLLADFYPRNVTNNRNVSELSALQVYFTKSTCNCYNRMLLIDFNYFIATYGGVFSLSFGASIITLFEMMYLLTAFTFKRLWKSLIK